MEKHKANEEVFRSRIIAVCGQSKVQPFEHQFPPKIFPNLEFLNSGSYSKVVKTKCLSDRDRVIKFIKLSQLSDSVGKVDDNSNKAPISAQEKDMLTEKMHSVFQEISIAKLLSNLHSTKCNSQGHEFRAHCFPKVYQTCLVNGQIPLGGQSNWVDVHHEHVAICMEDCGTSLRLALNEQQLSLRQFLSVCYQVMLGLTVGEMLYEYEHRDLHLQNIMVRRTNKSHLSFVIASKQYRVATHGIRAFIIDNTFARMRVGTEHYFTHLSGKLYKLANKLLNNARRDSMSEQHKVYVRMYETAKHDWSQWMPQTNLYWMRHVVLSGLGLISDHADSNNLTEIIKLARYLSYGTTLQAVLQKLITRQHKAHSFE